MMTLYEKITNLYPELLLADFSPSTGTISLLDNSDGNGVFIAKWEHPTLSRPTDTQLAEIE
jgi:hypothetical protein